MSFVAIGCETGSTSERSAPSLSTSEVTLFSNGWVHASAREPAKLLTISVLRGRIHRIGTDELFAGERAAGAREISLDGACVLPGLTDAHAHVYSLGSSLERLALGGLSKSEILERVARAASERKGNGTADRDDWIEGRGWDQNLWPGGEFPTASELDRAALGRPVALDRVDGHASWVSSSALRAAGIGKETADPPGGRIVRDRNGDPTGVLIDRAVELLYPAIPPPSDETIRRRLVAATSLAASLGLTSVHDAGVDGAVLAPRVLRELEKLANGGALPIRVYHMLSGDGDPAWLDSELARPPRSIGKDDRLRVSAVKFYLDGALGSRGAALLAEYADDPGNRGLILTPPNELRRKAEKATRAGYQVAIHAIGDRANRLALELYEALGLDFGGDRRFRIEHAQVVATEDLFRFKRAGVIASMQPTHATSDMPWAEARLGPERIRGAYAWRSLVNAGARLAFGSDFPIEEVDPSLGLFSAVTRTDRSSRPPGGWRPGEKLSLEEAIEGFTEGAAYAAFEETERGRLAPGFRADMTVYESCPFRVEPFALRGLPVRATVVGGDVVFDRTQRAANRDGR